MQHYLEGIDLTGEKILEVGCAAGGLFEILTKKFGQVEYTGLDISPAEIKFGRKYYPEAQFICQDFMKNRFKEDAFDTAICFQVLPHQPNYRGFIRELCRIAARRAIFDVRLRYEGPTIVDIDQSYVYYHETGMRNHHIVMNFFELWNFLHIEDIRARKISVYGYHAPAKTTAFVPLSKSKIVSATFCVEKYPPEKKVFRCGAREEFVGRKWVEAEVKLPGITENDI
jgi:SAM-dependent methyltransferase